MKLALVRQIIQPFPIRSGIGNDMGLYHEITGLIVFFLISANILLILMSVSTKYNIFVWLFSCGKVDR